MRKKTRVILNSASNIGDFLASIIITLLMTPIYLFALGKHDYGIWEIITIVIGYMGLLDLGIRSAVVRYCSYYLAQNDAAQVRKVYSTALIYMTGIGIVCLGLFALWAYFNPESLSETGGEKEKYASLLFWVGLSVLLSFIRNTSEGMIEGSQKYLIKNLINLVIKIGIAIYLWSYLNEQSGILLLIKVAIVGTLLRIFAYNILLAISIPKITPFERPNFQTLIELFKFGAKSLVNGVAYTIHNSSGTFLIGVLLTPAAVPLYSIPKSIVNYIYTFIETASNVLTPYFVELDRSESNNEVVTTYLFYSKLLIWFLTTAATFTVAFGHIFISLWLPGQFEEETIQLLIFVLIFGVVVERMNPLALKVSSAKNKHMFFAKVRPFAAALTFILSYFLITSLGVVGACLATAITAMIFTPLFARHSFSLINLSFLNYWSESIKPNVATALALCGVAFLIDEYALIDNFGTFLTIFAVFSLVSMVSLIGFTLTREERDSCMSMLISAIRKKK